MRKQKTASQQLFEELDESARYDHVGRRSVLDVATVLVSVIIASLLTAIPDQFGPKDASVVLFTWATISLLASIAMRSSCPVPGESCRATDLILVLSTSFLGFLGFVMMKSPSGESWGMTDMQFTGLLTMGGLLFVALPALVIRELILLRKGPAIRVISGIIFSIFGISLLAWAPLVPISICITCIFLRIKTKRAGRNTDARIN